MLHSKTLAIDIGGTFIKYGVVQTDGQITERYKVPTGEHLTRKALYDYICKNIISTDVECVGICAPGLVDRNDQVRSYGAPNLKALYDSNIRQEIEQRTGLPAAAINDARAAGLCELKFGRARGSTLSAFLIIGTGGGGCFCTEKDVFAGVDNFAGEFHFLSYLNEQTGEDMKMGRTIGMMGLIARYNERADISRRASLGEEIIARAFTGETLAGELVDDWVHRVALQCLNLAVLINPELICIGGGISEEDWFMEQVRREYDAICEAHFNGAHFLTTVIDRCQYCNDANLLGAALKVNMEINNRRDKYE